MDRVYFTDRDLGKQFPARLRAAGLSVEWFFDHFADKTPDTECLSAAGTRGWIVPSACGIDRQGRPPRLLLADVDIVLLDEAGLLGEPERCARSGRHGANPSSAARVASLSRPARNCGSVATQKPVIRETL